MEVKLNHVSHLSDARYAAGMGVRWIGIQCDEKSPYYVSPVRFAEISQWVVGPGFVAELSSLSVADGLEWIEKKASIYRTELIEIADSGILKEIDPSIPFFYRHQLSRVEDLAQLDELPRPPEAYLLSVDPPLGANLKGELLLWAAKRRVLLHMPMRIEEIASLKGSTITGLALDSEPEPRAGWRDYGDLSEILEFFDTEDT